MLERGDHTMNLGEFANGSRDARSDVMSWIKTLSETEATGALAAIYAQITGRAGAVSNVLKIESLNPAALRAHLMLYGTIMFGESPLTRAEREAVAVVVSATNGCHY
jgi:uncharacterized peroxidase-related enzyme